MSENACSAQRTTRRSALKTILGAALLTGPMMARAGQMPAAQSKSTEIEDRFFGVKGDGATNDTRALQSAIDRAAGSTLVITGYSLVDTTGLTLRSGTRIRFAPGASLCLMPHHSASYQVLRIWDVSDVEVLGARIDGNKSANTATPYPDKEGYGMGISITGSRRVRLVRPVTNDCWGDGIYVANSYRDKGTLSSDIVIEQHRADGCRRQGISLVSGRDVRIVDGQWTNIGGTLPSAGLDIEPNSNADTLEGIRVVDPVTRNCATGIQVWLPSLCGPVAKRIDIEVVGHTDEGSQHALVIKGAPARRGEVSGRIVSRGGQWLRTRDKPYVDSGDLASVQVEVDYRPAGNPGQHCSSSACAGQSE